MNTFKFLSVVIALIVVTTGCKSTKQPAPFWIEKQGVFIMDGRYYVTAKARIGNDPNAPKQITRYRATIKTKIEKPDMCCNLAHEAQYYENGVFYRLFEVKAPSNS